MFALLLAAQDISELLEDIRARHDLPALAAAVVVDDEVTMVGVAGRRRYDREGAAVVDDPFHIGSCTKAMTATLIGMFVQEGRITWDTTVGEAFPDAEEGFRAVTVRQLLAHRGGMPHTTPTGYSLGDMHVLQGTPREQRLEYVGWLLEEEPAYEPGSQFAYSNAGYCVAAAVLERLVDASWEDLIRERIFDRLGMTTAGFGAPDPVCQHVWDGEEHRVIESGDNPVAINPAGRVHLSISDWARFVAVILDGEFEGDGIMEEATLRELREPAFEGEYAIGGWGVVERGWAGGAALTHAGSNTMNFAVAWLAPERGFAVLVATNEGGPGRAEACDEVASTLIRRHLQE